MKNKILSILFLMLFIPLTTCGGLIILKDNLQLKGKKIAIIAGTKNQIAIDFVDVLVDELKKNSNFEVIMQKEIANKIPSYPEEITGPFDSYEDTYKENYTKTDTKKINEIQKKLGVNYIYTVWIPLVFTKSLKGRQPSGPGIHFSGGADIEETWVMGQLFEYPNGEDIGRSNFEILVKKEGIIIGNVPDNLKDSMQMRCEELSTELAMKTGMSKKIK